MKNLLLFIFLCTFSVIAQNYSPLHLGNTYQYLIDGYGNMEGRTNVYYVNNTIIDKDTVIAGQTYYMVNGKWTRYDSLSNKLYTICNNIPVVQFDFNGGNTFTETCFYSPQLSNYSFASGTGNYFGQSISLKGYSYNATLGCESGNYYWGAGLGQAQAQNSTTFYGTFYNVSSKLLEAVIISDSSKSHFTYNQNPSVLSLQNDLDANILKFYVLADHPFSNTSRKFTYVDKVYLKGYYKKDNDIIPIDSVIFSQPGTDARLFKMDLSLDTFYLNNGYTFYYKAIAKDKGLVPNYTSYPDTGYLSKTILSVNDEKELVSNFRLSQNYPNPFNPSTNIQYYVPSECRVNVTIYNALGAKVKELVNGTESQGNYEVKFDGTGLASGIYFVTLKAASVDGKQSFTGSKKMILMK